MTDPTVELDLSSGIDFWELEREDAYLWPADPPRSPLAGWDLGMLTDQITPCPKCGSFVTVWAKGELVPECSRCGLRASSVTGYRIIWPYSGDGAWTEPRKNIGRPPHTQEAQA